MIGALGALGALGAIARGIGLAAKAAVPAATEAGIETAAVGVGTAGAAGIEAGAVATQVANVGAPIAAEAGGTALAGVEKATQVGAVATETARGASAAGNLATDVEEVLLHKGPDAALGKLAGEQTISTPIVAETVTEVGNTNQEILAKLHAIQEDQALMKGIMEKTGLDLARTQASLNTLIKSLEANQLTKQEIAVLLAVSAVGDIAGEITEKDEVEKR